MSQNDHPLGVITSQFVYENTVQRGHTVVKPDKLERVEIKVKEGRTTGWMWLVDGPTENSSQAQASERA